MKILFLAHLFPLPLDSGGKIKSFYTLRALAEEHDVRLLAYLRSDQEESLVPELAKICEVRTVHLKRGALRQVFDLAAATGLRRSFVVGRDYRRDMMSALRGFVREFRPDALHIDHLQMAQFADFRAPYRTVLDHHNVEHMIVRRMSETSDSRPTRLYAALEWPKLRRYELDVCRKCDLALTVSEEDGRTLRSLAPDIRNIETVPIGVDVRYFRPVERVTGSINILSVGTMYWPPNVDSILYFCREILPLVRKRLPECTLTIAGQKPVQAVWDLASDPSIRVTGYVDDVREIARNCGVFIVPLRSGSGVRVKILNALAMGLPIVSTSIGVEGLAVEDGRHALLADTPEHFANAVARVLEDPGLADSLGREGRELVCEAYSWEAVGGKLLEIYRDQFDAE